MAGRGTGDPRGKNAKNNDELWHKEESAKIVSKSLDLSARSVYESELYSPEFTFYLTLSSIWG